MMNDEKKTFQASSSCDLRSIAEDLYFWLMRSTSEPKIYAETFQILSQIMRIVELSKKGGNYLSPQIESEVFVLFSQIKDQVQDGGIQKQQLAGKLLRILQKLVYENPKAQLIAHATEIEYIFCINSHFVSSCSPSYQQKFKKYLKAIVDTVHSDLSPTQTKAIVQILSQIAKNPRQFSEDPQKDLSESLKKSGILVLDPHLNEESQTA